MASNVERYKALSKAVSLGNTLRSRFKRRIELLRLSIAFVVYIIFLTLDENLNIGEIASQLSTQLFIELGYCFSHFSFTSNIISYALSSDSALYIAFKSLEYSFLSLYETCFNVFLTW